MTDVRTYTASMVLPAWAIKITDTIRAGDLTSARQQFTEAAAQANPKDATYAVAAAVEPGRDEITAGEAPRGRPRGGGPAGEAPRVFGNPFRPGYAWRCGACLAAFRTGGPDPHAGAGYKTPRGALSTARKHGAEGHTKPVPVVEVTR